MKKITLTILSAVLLPGLSLAQDSNNYLCSNGDLQRRVEIVYETGVTVPCEVHYYKDTEAPGFITQLASWGWDCTQGAAPEADMPDDSDKADDTEALAPVDEVEATAES
jgi:hypothetical protein